MINLTLSLVAIHGDVPDVPCRVRSHHLPSGDRRSQAPGDPGGIRSCISHSPL